MKVFVCGSLYEKSFPSEGVRDNIILAAKQIGNELVQRGFKLVVGIDIAESVDKWVVEGALQAVRGTKNSLEITVYYLANISPPPFENLIDEPNIDIEFHNVQPDIWHIAHMRAVDKCDCVLLIAGRAGTLVSGLYSMLRGVPFLPLAHFGGGAKTLWSESRADYEKYFYNTLTLEDLDLLNSPWQRESPRIIIDYLVKITSSRKQVEHLNICSTIIASLGLIIGILAFVYCLRKGRLDFVELGLVWLIFLTLSSSVAAKSFSILVGLSIPKIRHCIDVLRTLMSGLGSGFLAFLVLPFVQFLAEGKISMKISGDDYIRFGLFAGALGFYSGLQSKRIYERFLKIIEGRLARTNHDDSK